MRYKNIQNINDGYFLAHREILYAFFFTYPVVGILIPEPFIKYADLF